MIIRDGDFANESVLALLRAHLAGMHANSPPGSVNALDLSGLQRRDVSFYAVWDRNELLGIGALKEIGALTGEVKSMRTAEAHLRRGAGALMLDHLIKTARARGYRRLSLETGSGPAFEPAIALYRRYGFEYGGPFGEYEASAFNQFMHLEI
jgi:putative acetyltransferase